MARERDRLRWQDEHLEWRELAKRWLRLELISPSAAAEIVAAHPSRLIDRGLALRLVQIVGVAVAGVALTLFLTTTLFQDSWELGVLTIGVAAGGAAALLVARGRFCAGVDEGLWLLFVLLTPLALSSLLERGSGDDFARRAFFLLAAAAALVPATLGYLLAAVLAWGASSALLLDLSGDLRAVAAAQLALVAALGSVQRRMAWRRRMRQVAVLRVAAAVAALVTVNSYLPALLFGAGASWGSFETFPRAQSLVLVPALAMGLAVLGWRGRSRVLLDTGVVGVVLAAVTLGVALLGLGLDLVLIVVGGLVVALVLLARGALRDARDGWTSSRWTSAIPLGWSREDLESTAGWAQEILAGARRQRAPARSAREGTSADF